MKSKKIIIGSRGSKLALIYAERSKAKILEFASHFGFEDVIIKKITTTGDVIQDKRLSFIIFLNYRYSCFITARFNS